MQLLSIICGSGLLLILRHLQEALSHRCLQVGRKACIQPSTFLGGLRCCCWSLSISSYSLSCSPNILSKCNAPLSLLCGLRVCRWPHGSSRRHCHMIVCMSSAQAGFNLCPASEHIQCTSWPCLWVDNKVFMMHWGTAIEHNHSLDSALVVTPIHTELSEHFQQFLRLCS